MEKPAHLDRGGTFVVIPAYNEARSLPRVLPEIVRAYPDVVVVDDGSSDATYEAARANVPWTLRHVVNRGQGAALQTGIEFALRQGAEYIVTFDADGQHAVGDIERLLQPIQRGACQVTLGSRFLGDAVNMSLTRECVLRAAVHLSRFMHRLPLTDAHNGLRAFSRDAAQKVNLTMDRMAHASEMLDIIRRHHLTFQEVPVQIHYTEYSLSKGQSLSDAPRILFHYLVGRIFG